jgi:hypothetical protein
VRFSRPELLHALTAKIQAIEVEHRPHGGRCLDLGIPGLERLVPDGRLPAGALVELLSAETGAGAWTLALLLAKQVCVEPRAFVVVDGERCFYPPAAARLGLDLNRTLVIRPRSGGDAQAALVQTLRSAAVGSVLSGFDPPNTRAYRQLQLAAEAGGGIGFLIRGPKDEGREMKDETSFRLHPSSFFLRRPSFATLRLLVRPLKDDSSFRLHPSSFIRRLRIDVLRSRGGREGRSLCLEIDHETNLMRVLPEVAAATAAGGARRESVRA